MPRAAGVPTVAERAGGESGAGGVVGGVVGGGGGVVRRRPYVMTGSVHWMRASVQERKAVVALTKAEA